MRKLREQQPARACASRAPQGFSIQTISVEGRTVQGFVHAPSPASNPVILFSYGLYDSASSRYVRLIADALAKDGYGVVVPDMPWHGCCLHDDPRGLATLGIAEAVLLAEWARTIRVSHPRSRVELLGFSLGAQNVIYALSSPEAVDLFDGGIAISPPGDLPRTVARLDEAGSFRADGMARMVRFFFRSNLAGRLRLLEVEPTARPFSQYMDLVAAMEHRSTEEIIDSVAPEKRLALVRRPLLLVVSKGDPVFPDSVPQSLKSAAENNPYTFVLETPFGGHIGHMAVAPKWFVSLLHTFYSSVPPAP